MYSDDPDEETTEKEKIIISELIEFINKYKNMEFGIKQVSKDLYQIFNLDKSVTAELNIGKKHYLKIN